MLIRRVKGLIKLTFLSLVRFLYMLFGGRVVHVIGDSHSLAFQDYRILVHHLGAVTAYNLVRSHSSTGGREKLLSVINRIRKKDSVMLVFGEIDSRIHVYNQYMKQQKRIPMLKIIKNIIANYSQIIDEIKKKGINVVIYNLVPPGNQGNVYKYPYYAGWKTRLWITKKMNALLSEICKRRGIKFINIFEELVNKDQVSPKNYRRKEFIFDEVHLNENVTGLVISDLKREGFL